MGPRRRNSITNKLGGCRGTANHPQRIVPTPHGDKIPSRAKCCWSLERGPMLVVNDLVEAAQHILTDS